MEPVRSLPYGDQVETPIGKRGGFGFTHLIVDIGLLNGIFQLIFADVGGFHLPEMLGQYGSDLPVAGSAVPGRVECLAAAANVFQQGGGVARAKTGVSG